MWTPSQVPFCGHTVVEPLLQSHEVEIIISCPLGKGVPEAPAHLSSLISTLVGHTHNKVIYVTGVSHVLCQTRLGRLKATLDIFILTLSSTHTESGRAS